MDTEKLKYVVGSVKANEPAVIRFFDEVNNWTAAEFVHEFLWLEKCNPSKITVLINSEGGGIIPGMSVFSVIYNCKIPTECVIEGIAASMGSVIWCAGKKQFMRDFSLLMLHNPHMGCREMDDNAKQIIEAFTAQISSVYKSRLKIDGERLKAIMDGPEGADGTFFTAEQAVSEGFLPAENIIQTDPIVRERAAAVLSLEGDRHALREGLNGVFDALAPQSEEKKPENETPTINSQINTTVISNTDTMEEKNTNTQDFILAPVSAQLGLQSDAQLGAVSARIAELIKSEGKLREAEDKVSELNIQLAGKVAEVENLNSQLAKANADLQKFQEAEQKAKDEAINSLVDAAIEAGKIAPEAKQNWIDMAHTNVELVRNTLQSIPAREKITQEIASDPENVNNIQNALSDVEGEVRKEYEKRFGKYEPLKF